MGASAADDDDMLRLVVVVVGGGVRKRSKTILEEIETRCLGRVIFNVVNVIGGMVTIVNVF